MVLVEVGKIENLKKAYPNYFGDVEIFRNQLRLVTRGLPAMEYTMLPKQTIPPRGPQERVYNPFGAGRLPRPSVWKRRKRYLTISIGNQLGLAPGTGGMGLDKSI